jgi:hypothetical protein
MFSLLVINERGLGIEVTPAIRAEPILRPATRRRIFHFFPAPEKSRLKNSETDPDSIGQRKTKIAKVNWVFNFVNWRPV